MFQLPGLFWVWMAAVAAIAVLAMLWTVTEKGVCLVAFVELSFETYGWAVGGIVLAGAAATLDAYRRKGPELMAMLRAMSEAMTRVLVAWVALVAVAATLICYF